MLGLLLVGAGCGGAGSPAPDDARRPGRVPGQSSLGVEVVAILAMTAADGRVTDHALELDTTADVDRLVEGVGGGLARRVRAAVGSTAVPAGRRLLGQVVDIGCGRPDGIRVSEHGGAVTLEPTYAVKPPPECFAPVTSIALVLLHR